MHGVHVVRLVRRVRDERVEERVLLRDVRLDVGVEDRRLVQVVARQVRQQLLDVLDRVVLVGTHVVRVAAARVVRARAAEVLHRDVLAGDGLDHVRPGDEHLRGLVDHHHEVGQRGGVDVPAGRRAHDQRDLRDHAAGVHVALEDLAVQPERDHALLDARAAALVDPDDRAAELHRQVEHLDDLLAVDLAQAAAEDRDVLAEHRDRPAVHRAVAGDHAVAVRALLLLAEVRGAVPGQLVHLDEAALVEQHLDPLAGRLLALGVLLLDHPLRPGVHGLVVAPVQVGELAGRGVDVDLGLGRDRSSVGVGRAGGVVVRHEPQRSARRLGGVDGTAWGDLSRPPLREGALRRAVLTTAPWTALDVVPATGSTNADLAAAVRAGTGRARVGADHGRPAVRTRTARPHLDDAAALGARRLVLRASGRREPGAVVLAAPRGGAGGQRRADPGRRPERPAEVAERRPGGRRASCAACSPRWWSTRPARASWSGSASTSCSAPTSCPCPPRRRWRSRAPP